MRRKYVQCAARGQGSLARSPMPIIRPAGCASQLTGPGCEVADCTPSAPSAQKLPPNLLFYRARIESCAESLSDWLETTTTIQFRSCIRNSTRENADMNRTLGRAGVCYVGHARGYSSPVARQVQSLNSLAELDRIFAAGLIYSLRLMLRVTALDTSAVSMRTIQSSTALGQSG